MTTTSLLGRTSRDDIDHAVGVLEFLYTAAFGSKTMGRFVVTRDQIKKILHVKNLRENTFFALQAHVLERSDLVLSELPDDLFGVVAVRKAIRWRRVPKAALADAMKIGDLGMGAEVIEATEAEEDE